MSSIHILYEAKDHQNKATALMNSLANTATIDPVDAVPRKIVGLTTLIFWGHGSATGLCDKSSAEILKIIYRWRDLNSGLNTIEIITCNSRHFDDVWLPKTDKTGAIKRDSSGKAIPDAPKTYLASQIAHMGSGKKINNSMAKQIKRGLKYSIYPSMRRLTLKSMPESVNGSFKQYSILYFETVTFTWCYVTGATEQEMFAMGNNISKLKKVPADPHVLWGGARPGDFPTRLASAKIDFPDADFTDVKAGMINELRDILVDIG